MHIFDVHPILYTTCFIFMLSPSLLFLVFAIIGREERRTKLKALFKSDTKVADILSDARVSSDLPLGDFFCQRYDETHSLSRFWLSLLIFHIIYLFGLYWSCVSLGFAVDPENAIWSVGDINIFPVATVGAAGFIGSALAVLWHLFWRTMRSDIQPRSFTHFAARLMVAPVLAIAVTRGIFSAVDNQNAVMFIAFGCGMLTEMAFRLIERRWLITIQVSGKSATAELPLRNLQGLTRNDELRLWEEGIADSEHLAVEAVERLLVGTNYSLERLIDWKDQALLYVYVQEEFPKWRELHARGVLDILGLAPTYYGKKKHDQICDAIAKKLQKDKSVVARFIDTIYNDPRVHQLWRYLVDAYPTKFAKPIVPSNAHDLLTKPRSERHPSSPSRMSK